MATMDRIKLRHLHSLVAVSEHGALVRAAEALSVTQPAVSKTLAELEDIVGQQLFKRSPRGVALTDAGQQLLRYAGSSLRTLREGLDETLTVQGLGITGALYRTLRTTNPVENLNGSIAHYTRNVKRWKDGQMTLRWIASAFSDAAGRFRKLKGHRDMKSLLTALELRAPTGLHDDELKAA